MKRENNENKQKIVILGYSGSGKSTLAINQSVMRDEWRSRHKLYFLIFPYICLFRIVKRYFTYQRKSREAITEGCKEKIDKKFLWWILYKGWDKGHKEWYQQVCKLYSDKAIVLKNPEAVKKFLIDKRCNNN